MTLVRAHYLYVENTLILFYLFIFVCVVDNTGDFSYQKDTAFKRIQTTYMPQVVDC